MAVTEAQVICQIKVILNDNLGEELDQVLGQDTRFEDDLGLDSLNMIELVMGLEGVYGISIDDEDVEQLTTVGVKADYILERLGVSA